MFTLFSCLSCHYLLDAVTTLISLFAVIFNAILMVVHAKKMYLNKNGRSHKSYVNRMILFNLVLADLLTGVIPFAAMLRVIDNDGVSSCGLAQVLIMAASEASVNVLALLAIFRLHIVRNPIKARFVLFRLWCGGVLIAWAHALTLVVVVPVLNQRYSSVKFRFWSLSLFPASECEHAASSSGDRNASFDVATASNLSYDSTSRCKQSTQVSTPIDV